MQFCSVYGTRFSVLTRLLCTTYDSLTSCRLLGCSVFVTGPSHLPKAPVATDRVLAQVRTPRRELIVSEGRNLENVSIVPTPVLTQLPFLQACEAWLESRRPYLSAKTFYEYSLNIKALGIFFKDFRLLEIDGDMLRAFQRWRRQKCGAPAINHECNLLCQIRKRIGVPLVDYQPLPLSKDKVGRVLSDPERERILRVASTSPHWEAAYLFAMISVNSTAGPKEVASLRFKDIDLVREEMHIPRQGAKNSTRARPIPLNAEALKGITMAMERARSLGSFEPDHHLFPFRIHRSLYDPTRFQTTFKTAWKKMTVAAMLGGLRMYDLRRTAITALLENPEISYETVQEIAGHTPGSPMTKRYSHIRVNARRKAVESLAVRKPVVSERHERPKPEPSPDRDRMTAQLVDLLGKLLKTG